MSISKKILQCQKKLQQNTEELNKLKKVEKEIIDNKDVLTLENDKINEKLLILQAQNDFYQHMKDFLCEDVCNIIFDYSYREIFTIFTKVHKDDYSNYDINDYQEIKYEFHNYVNTDKYIEILDKINTYCIDTLRMNIYYMCPFGNSYYKQHETYDLNHILSLRYKEITNDMKVDEIEKYKKEYRILYSFDYEYENVMTYFYINKKIA